MGRDPSRDAKKEPSATLVICLKLLISLFATRSYVFFVVYRREERSILSRRVTEGRLKESIEINNFLQKQRENLPVTRKISLNNVTRIVQRDPDAEDEADTLRVRLCTQ